MKDQNMKNRAFKLYWRTLFEKQVRGGGWSLTSELWSLFNFSFNWKSQPFHVIAAINWKSQIIQSSFYMKYKSGINYIYNRCQNGHLLAQSQGPHGPCKLGLLSAQCEICKCMLLVLSLYSNSISLNQSFDWHSKAFPRNIIIFQSHNCFSP